MPQQRKKGRGGAGGDDDDEALDGEEAAALALAAKLREDQKQRNKAEFEGEGDGGRLRFEGFRQGLYVRVAIKGVSAEFSRNFRPALPVVVGGLLPHEMTMGLLRCRVKRHRWHRKVGPFFPFSLRFLVRPSVRPPMGWRAALLSM